MEEMNSRPLVLDGKSPEPQRDDQKEDKYIDMQYGKHSCKDKKLFTAQPWEHCKDPTSTYLGLRISKRNDFKSNLTPAQLNRLEHEERRIRKTRANFASYEPKKAMLSELTEARKEWKEEVTMRLSKYAQGKEQLDRYRNLDMSIFHFRLWT